jgi:hypothetical protein
MYVDLEFLVTAFLLDLQLLSIPLYFTAVKSAIEGGGIEVCG